MRCGGLIEEEKEINLVSKQLQERMRKKEKRKTKKCRRNKDGKEEKEIGREWRKGEKKLKEKQIIKGNKTLMALSKSDKEKRK